MTNEYIINHIYTTILKFDDDIDTELAWKIANIIGKSSKKEKEVTKLILDGNVFNLKKPQAVLLAEALIRMTKGRKSFAKFYNSTEARKERNSVIHD